MTCGINVCGTGGYTGPQPGDPDASNVAVTASPAFGGIDITWTYPAINPQAVAHIELYRGTVNNSAAAFLIAIVSGNTHFDKLNTGLTYYYWIKVVSVHGTVGDFIGPASAIARPRITDLIEDLTGQIDNGVLAPSLKSTLDQISMLNANLAQEVFDRETGQTSFGQALADVQTGVAEAHTFIANEITTRTTANSAMAEQIQLTAVTLGDELVAVAVKADAWIDPVTGAGALWGPQLTVDGLVGGFGIANDGYAVEAGFDVDTFWVGRTLANKRKPFIIDSVTGETYINNAVIHELSADHIDSRGLSIRDAMGNIILSAGDTIQNQINPYSSGATVNQDDTVTNAAISAAEAAAITTAAADATAKANSAQAAAITAAATAAQTKADLAEITAKAYADGIVTAAEAALIADATTKANAAETAATEAAALDATAKADAVGATAAAALAHKLDAASTAILGINASDTVRMSGIRVGDLVWNSSGVRTSGKGMALTPQGMLGHNGTNVTFEINATTGAATFSGTIRASDFTTGACTGYAWPAAGNYGTYLGPSGLLLGNFNNNKYFQVTHDGNLYAPGFSVVNGQGTIDAIDILRRRVLATGTISFASIVLPLGYQDPDQSWITHFYPVGTIVRSQPMYINTGLTDSFFMDNSKQQPLGANVYCTGTAHLSSGSVVVSLSTEVDVVRGRTYSIGGINTVDDNKIGIYVTLVLRIISMPNTASFTGPNAATWILYNV